MKPPHIQQNKWQEKLQDTDCLFYGELEFHLDKYIKRFFSVEVKDVGFDENHPMNTIEFWLVVSMLVRMDFLEYGTSPRGAWLTEEGEAFKKYCLSENQPITNIIHNSNEE